MSTRPCTTLPRSLFQLNRFRIIRANRVYADCSSSMRYSYWSGVLGVSLRVMALLRRSFMWVSRPRRE